MKTLRRGVVAGAAGTVVMTGFIMMMQRITGNWEIPPQQVSESVADQLSGHDPTVKGFARRHWLLAHLSYGAVGGALYSVLAKTLRVDGLKQGVVFGLAVWTGSYVGYLPKWDIYPSPERDTKTRLWTMVAAHCIYGLTLGYIDQRLGNRAKS